MLPRIKVHAKSRDIVDAFGGYNHNLRIADGEFYDMRNMSSTDYPVLSPRAPRGIYKKPSKALGLIAKEELCYVDGTNFVIGDDEYEMGLSDSPKSLVSMGAYVIILPDKKYINTISPEDRGDIEATASTTEAVTFAPCTISGVEIENITISDTEPTRTNMAYWLDTSVTPNVMKQYSSTSGTWVSLSATYVKISSAGIGSLFSGGDGVSISGVEDDSLESLNTSTVVEERDDDYIVVSGVIGKAVTQTSPITVSRAMPLMDFVIESDNRLWGCRYGMSANGVQVNELYASKLGDFKNWNVFAGISTDSYTASVGSDGPFTGAIAHLGHPIFFKEGAIHKIYGNAPSSYQIQTTAGRGVQKGCDKSLAIVNEVLYYKARSAVCAYDGSLPVEISSALGDEMYGAAVAGAVGNKYYISMISERDGEYNLFVYDTKKGMWHREDETNASAYAAHRGELYYIDSDGIIKTALGSGSSSGERVKWYAETGLLGVSDPDKKYISRIDVRMSLDVSSYVDLYIQYDSSGVWEKAFSMLGEKLRSFSVPVRAKRCDHMRLRLEGAGEAKVFSICKTIEGGGSL